MKDKIKLDSIRNFIKTDMTGLDINSIVERKQFTSQIGIERAEERTFIAKISTNGVDRDGDMLMPNGCDTAEYEQNPIVCWSHTYSIPPVGKVLAMQKTSDAIYIKVQMAETESARELWQLVKGGYLKTMSIGFIAVNALVRGTAQFNRYVNDMNLDYGDDCKRIVTQFRMIESSLVAIPANPEALVLAVSSKSIHINDKLARELELDFKAVTDKVGEVGEVGSVWVIDKAKNEQDNKTEKVYEDVIEWSQSMDTPVIDTKESTPIVPAIIETAQPIATEQVIAVEVAPEVIVSAALPSVEPEIQVELPVVEEVAKIQPIWTVLRVGPYVATECDKNTAKAIKQGKVL